MGGVVLNENGAFGGFTNNFLRLPIMDVPINEVAYLDLRVSAP